MKREEGSGVMGRFGLGVFSKLMGILGLLACFFFAFEGAAFAQDGGAVLGLGGLGSPIVSGMLIVLIVGGLYLEVQAPGAVIPMVIATVAALVFFIPLYSMGLVQGLDLGLFLVGLLLLLIEIFAIPGFGITGVLGLLGIFTGLTLSLVDNELLFAWQAGAGVRLIMAVTTVVASITVGSIGGILLGGVLIASPKVPALALRRNLKAEEGFVGVEVPNSELLGQLGVAVTVLRPSGKVLVKGTRYDAVAQGPLVEQGVQVRVVGMDMGTLKVEPVELNS